MASCSGAHQLFLDDHNKVRYPHEGYGQVGGGIHRFAFRVHAVGWRSPRLQGVPDATVPGELTCIGNLAYPRPVFQHAWLEFVLCDVCDAPPLPFVLPGRCVVMNFAANTHVVRPVEGAAEFAVGNITGAQAPLQAWITAQVVGSLAAEYVDHGITLVQVPTNRVHDGCAQQPYGRIVFSRRRSSWARRAHRRPTVILVLSSQCLGSRHEGIEVDSQRALAPGARSYQHKLTIPTRRVGIRFPVFRRHFVGAAVNQSI